MTPLDTNDLIAVATTNANAIQAFDYDDNDVLFDPNAPVPSLARTWELGEQPKAFAVELPLDPNQTFPQSLSELDFTVDGLYGQPFTTVDLPLEATEDWIDLAPNYRLRIEEVNLLDGVCRVCDGLHYLRFRAEFAFCPDGCGLKGHDLESGGSNTLQERNPNDSNECDTAQLHGGMRLVTGRCGIAQAGE